MQIREITVGLVCTCCYILSREDRDDCIVIDPGAGPDRIRKAAEGKRIAAILLTHGHFDHIGGVSGLMEDGVRLLIHEKDAPMLTVAELNASQTLLRRPFTAPPATDLLRDGQRLTYDEELEMLTRSEGQKNSDFFAMTDAKRSAQQYIEHSFSDDLVPRSSNEGLLPR